MTKLWNVITNAGKLNKQLKQPEQNLDIRWTSPAETSGGRLHFSDLEVVFKELGKYQLMFIIDGVESQLSDIVEIIENVQVQKMDNFISYLVNGLLLLCGLFVIFSNVGVRNAIFNINAILFLGVMSFTISALSLLGTGKSIMFYITASLIFLLLCEVLMGELKTKYNEISKVSAFFFVFLSFPIQIFSFMMRRS